LVAREREMISEARKLDPKVFIHRVSFAERDGSGRPMFLRPRLRPIEDQEDDGHAWIYEKRMGKQASKCKCGALLAILYLICYFSFLSLGVLYIRHMV